MDADKLEALAQADAEEEAQRKLKKEQRRRIQVVSMPPYDEVEETP